jgi:hypothetical protein
MELCVTLLHLFTALKLQEMTIFRRDRFGAICVDATSQQEETKFQNRPAVFASLTCGGLLGFLSHSSSPSFLLPNIIKQGRFQSAHSIQLDYLPTPLNENHLHHQGAPFWHYRGAFQNRPTKFSRITYRNIKT